MEEFCGSKFPRRPLGGQKWAGRLWPAKQSPGKLPTQFSSPTALLLRSKAVCACLKLSRAQGRGIVGKGESWMGKTVHKEALSRDSFVLT